MRDTALPIRKAYVEKLKNAILLGAKVVPIHDNVPTGTDYPFVVIRSQTSTISRGKRCNNYSTTILLDVVTGYIGNGGGFSNADKIGDSILQLVTQGLNNPEGFQIVSTSYELNRNLPVEDTGQYKIYRKQLLFRNQIVEFNIT